MKRRIWPDIVIVIAILAIGVGGVWTLWGDRIRGTKDRAKQAPITAPSAPTN